MGEVAEKDKVNTADIWELARRIAEAIPDVRVKVDPSATVGGFHFMDVSYGVTRLTVELRPGSPGPSYGLSLDDEETTGFEGCDCVFGHPPTLIKYLKLLIRPCDFCKGNPAVWQNYTNQKVKCPECGREAGEYPLPA